MIYVRDVWDNYMQPQATRFVIVVFYLFAIQEFLHTDVC